MRRHDFFFFNDTATTEIYTLSLHDALPISAQRSGRSFTLADRGRTASVAGRPGTTALGTGVGAGDRKSTRLNSSHANISYAVFCLKKKIIFSLILEHSSHTYSYTSIILTCL